MGNIYYSDCWDETGFPLWKRGTEGDLLLKNPPPPSFYKGGGVRNQIVLNLNFGIEDKKRMVKPVSDWPVYQGDVNKYDYSALGGGITLVAGGPPCQPFSIGGKAKGNRDSRDMFPEAIRAVRELNPKAVIIENVKGLLRPAFSKYFQYIHLYLAYPALIKKAGETWQEHLMRLEKHHTRSWQPGNGYKVLFRLLNAADFGVPQKRERVFFVAIRADLDLEWSFPRPTHSRDSLLHDQWVTGQYWKRHGIPPSKIPKMGAKDFQRVKMLESALFPPKEKPWTTVRDAIMGLPDPLSKEARDTPNHVFNSGAKAYPGHTGSALDEPAKTLKAGDHGVPGGENMMVLPDGGVRYFTVRESARLQTFPDNYVFPVSWTESMRQIGNAVPVNLGFAVAQSVAGLLRTPNRQS